MHLEPAYHPVSSSSANAALVARSAFLLIVAVFVFTCRTKPIVAQLMSPGYVWVEVNDRAGKPITGAEVVLYTLDGREVGSDVTDLKSEAWINKRYYYDHTGSKYVVRVIKPGFLTQEVLISTGAYYRDDQVKIALIASSSSTLKNALPKTKPLRSSKRRPRASGLSPPDW